MPLLDEPLGALDLKLRRQMQDELKAIQRRIGTTFVHVTHDQDEAMAIADDPTQEGVSVADLGPAVVADSAFFGTHHRVHLAPERAGDTRIVAHLPQTRAVSAGGRIQVRVDASMAVVLAAKEG